MVSTLSSILGALIKAHNTKGKGEIIMYYMVYLFIMRLFLVSRQLRVVCCFLEQNQKNKKGKQRRLPSRVGELLKSQKLYFFFSVCLIGEFFAIRGQIKHN